MERVAHYPRWNEVVEFGSNGPTHKTLFETDSYKAVLVGLEAGVKIPPHPAAAATYHFLEGSGWMDVEGERIVISQGETVVVPAGIPRGVEAETRLSFLGSHGVGQKENPRLSMKMGLPMILGGVLMVGLMIGFMVTPMQMLSRMGGLGLGMWGFMLIPVLGMAAMMVGMAFLYRRMASGKGMPAMMPGHNHFRASQGAESGGSTLTFNVPSVNCDNCKMAIEQAVGEVQGVVSVHVNVGTKQAEVKFSLPATQDQIEAVLTEIGHSPKGVAA